MVGIVDWLLSLVIVKLCYVYTSRYESGNGTVAGAEHSLSRRNGFSSQRIYGDR